LAQILYDFSIGIFTFLVRVNDHKKRYSYQRENNVGVLVPGRRRSLHALIAQNLADTEALLARLENGVGVAHSGRELVRDLYVSCRRQREVLEAALRLELE
jgi:hypothetical protein